MADIFVLSGGLDSTAVLSLNLPEERSNVRALAFSYGQRHVKELRSAEAVAAHYGIPLEVRDITGTLSGGSLMGDGEIPTGEYSEDTMYSTVVHGRNLLFASLAVAQARPGDRVFFGVHSGDHFIYGDCRPEFWEALNTATAGAYGVEVVTPAVHLTKADLVRLSSAVGAPLELTWSCYKGEALQCGECSTCVERREAFTTAGVLDPTEYVR